MVSSPPGNPTVEQLQKGRRARAAIAVAIPKAQRFITKTCLTANAIWMRFRELVGEETVFEQLRHYETFVSYTMLPDQTMEQYFSVRAAQWQRLKSVRGEANIWDDLTEQQKMARNLEYAFWILRGIQKTKDGLFDDLITLYQSRLGTTNMPSVHEMLNNLKYRESSTEDSEMIVGSHSSQKVHQKTPPVCPNCHPSRHWLSDCPKKSPRF